MSSFFGLGRLTREQRRLWNVGAGIIVAGTVFKFAYFNFSRNLMVTDMDKRHLRAHSALQESREFAKWSKKDREDRLPDLTEDQRKQLRDYLALMAEHQPEIYPQRKP